MDVEQEDTTIACITQIKQVGEEADTDFDREKAQEHVAALAREWDIMMLLT